MRLFRILKYQILLLVLFSSFAYPQFIKNYEEISKKDLIDALSFTGLDIINLDLEKVDRNYAFKVIIEEYAGKDNLISSNIAISEFTEYKKPAEDGKWEIKYIHSLRLISKVMNNSFDKIFLMFSTEKFDAYRELDIDGAYQRKHYWVRFAKSDFKIGTKIPLLFYGSEWDDIIDGKKVPRFCSKIEVSTALDDETIKFITHFFIVSYMLEDIKE
jgi:hypothetical protein